mmetsp:Transcript_26083/g.84218  ORF Transcript_26083/g.84218 Transcript_26083/m.84218 type:complete len:353 (-) Transcript_26083:1725-2783(-)|eukprot:scaffold19937_cov127-Isochrysis_galbana.AAC.5
MPTREHKHGDAVFELARPRQRLAIACRFEFGHLLAYIAVGCVRVEDAQHIRVHFVVGQIVGILARHVAQVFRRPGAYELPADFGVPCLRGQDQCRVGLCVALVDGDARVKQRAHQLHLALLRRMAQERRRAANAWREHTLLDGGPLLPTHHIVPLVHLLLALLIDLDFVMLVAHLAHACVLPDLTLLQERQHLRPHLEDRRALGLGFPHQLLDLLDKSGAVLRVLAALDQGNERARPRRRQPVVRDERVSDRVPRSPVGRCAILLRHASPHDKKIDRLVVLPDASAQHGSPAHLGSPVIAYCIVGCGVRGPDGIGCDRLEDAILPIERAVRGFAVVLSRVEVAGLLVQGLEP